MRPVLAILLSLCLITGCTEDPKAPVYDTKNNPDNFPESAIELIDQIESSQLVQFDQIVMAFADLYTSESSLLDNQAWKEIIDRLGSKFNYRAGLALEDGLRGYHDAATNFRLASFAHPDNLELDRLSRLFSTWSDRVNNDTTSLYKNLNEINLTKRIDILRQFELADSLSRVFSKEFLRTVILGKEGVGGIKSDQSDQLSIVDRCLLAYTGLLPYETDEYVATWGETSINLVAAEVTQTRPGWYLVEMYFKLEARIEKDYTIALQAMTVDTLPDISDGKLNYIPFDFSPVKPSSQWPPGKIMATAKQIYFDQTLEKLKIGIYLRDFKKGQLKLTKKEEAMFTLEINSETN